MKKKIFQSIMLVAAAVLAATILIISGVLYEYFGGIQDRLLAEELNLAAVAVEQNGIDYLSGVKSTSRLTWVDAEGRVLFDTHTKAEDMENHADRAEIIQALSGAEGASERYSETLLQKTFYRARRLSDGTVLRISAGRASALMLFLGMLQPLIVVLAAVLVLAFALAGRVSEKITSPLNKLNLDAPLKNEAYEELSPLLRRINLQQLRIKTQMEELQQSRDEFSQIINSMQEALVLINNKRSILSINPAALALFGADAACIGRDFLTVDRSHNVTWAIEAALQSGHSETRLPRGGRSYQLDISRIESGGRVIGAVLLAFDITEQHLAETKRREFTANVSHELKTPLQAIMGSAELLENGLVKAEDVPQFVGRIRGEAGRLLAMIEDILRLSQLDEGSADMQTEELNITELIAEVVNMLSAKAAAKNVSLTVSGDNLTVRSVRSLLSEVIYNLCDNAIKYNIEGGTVDISAAEEGGKTVLTVKDSGIGIPPEHQPRVFERFYRVDKSHSNKIGGTGLGLSIVKHAVAELGGQIDLQSTPGVGTKVRLTL